MLWLLFALGTAFFDAVKNLLSKISLKDIDEYTVSWAFRIFTVLFLVPVVLFMGIPQINTQFWLALIVGGSLNTLTTVMYMKAYKLSDLSITTPITTFTPLFMLITSPIILGEFPSLIGIAGIVLIVTGSYMLNINRRKVGYSEPFRALLRDKGTRLMFGVAFIWSITSNIDKIGLQNSSPVFWAFSISAFVSVILSFVVPFTSKQSTRQVRSNLLGLAGIGLSTAILLVFQMLAITMTLVAYVISIKRAGAVITVIFGYFFLKEKNIRQRLLGASIMVVGVVLISLF